MMGAESMPRVPGQPCTNHTIRAYIFGSEPHARPHWHLMRGDDCLAVFCIETGEKIVGDPSSKELHEAQDWAKDNIELLRTHWRKYHGSE